MSNKKIEIDPRLLSIKNTLKTQKNKVKSHSLDMKPLISPNVLKNKLLKRIKEHKSQEQHNSEVYEDKEGIDILKYTDEFNDSINYLQKLTNQQKQDIKKEELRCKTVKNYNSTPFVFNELPDELKVPIEPIIIKNQRPPLSEPQLIQRQPTIQTQQLIHPPPITHTQPITYTQPITHTQPLTQINNVNEDIPYGILKGGIKPTYREWRKTQKIFPVNNVNKPISISISQTNKNNSEREIKLQALKDKFKPIMTEQNDTKSRQPTFSTANKYNKTIRKKYTLGKSNNKKTVSILLKDKPTQKLVISSQKELKNKSIDEIKKYLREHNLIKIGTNTPNDVLRKLYESAMLTGDVTNINEENLLHNFIKS